MTNFQASDETRKFLDRYQISASIYDGTDPQFPGLIVFEFVHYGRGDAELAGLIEISAKDDAELSSMVKDAVERLAGDSVLPLTVDGKALTESATPPTNWRVMLATGSKTDFVIWAEVEAISHEGDFTTVRSGHLGGAVARRLQAEWDTIFNSIIDRNPTLLPIQHQCSSCNANWEAGECSDSAECKECAGFAKERQCNCSEDCDEIVIRDTASTHLSKEGMTFPCPRSNARGVDWSGDPWAVQALARKLHVLEHEN